MRGYLSNKILNKDVLTSAFQPGCPPPLRAGILGVEARGGQPAEKRRLAWIGLGVEEPEEVVAAARRPNGGKGRGGGGDEDPWNLAVAQTSDLCVGHPESCTPSSGNEMQELSCGVVIHIFEVSMCLATLTT